MKYPSVSSSFTEMHERRSAYLNAYMFVEHQSKLCVIRISGGRGLGVHVLIGHLCVSQRCGQHNETLTCATQLRFHGQMMGRGGLPSRSECIRKVFETGQLRSQATSDTPNRTATSFFSPPLGLKLIKARSVFVIVVYLTPD